MMRNNRKKEVLEYLEKIADSRGVNLPENILENKNDENENKDGKEEEEELGFLDLIKHTIIVRCMLIGKVLILLLVCLE